MKAADRAHPRSNGRNPSLSLGVLLESPDKSAGTILFAESKEELERLVRERRDVLKALGEPFVPTPKTVALRMLRLARVKPGETLYDLGCGEGRIPILAAKLFGANSVGVELRRDLAAEAASKVREMHLESRVKIIRGDFMRTSIRRADIVALYLRSSTLAELLPKFKHELRRGARIVTYQFPIPGWKYSKKARLFEREIHLFGRERYLDRRLEREIYLYQL